MLATLEGKRQVTASVKLQQCDWQPQQSAASRFVGSETGVEKVKRKQLQLTGPQVCEHLVPRRQHLPHHSR